MPNAALRPCAGGCGALVPRGRCSTCARQTEQRRGTSTDRGYDARWRHFRKRFLAMLVDRGIVPVCGAALPDGPQTSASACRSAGLLTFTSADGSSLHLDHEPPLRDDERQDVARVCQATRIVLLCQACHAVKTATEEHRGIPDGGSRLMGAAEKGLPRSVEGLA